MTTQLAKVGAHVDALYYCPHQEDDACSCRKPKPGMLESAAHEHGVDLSRSFVVGDRYSDIEMAHRVEARAILVRTGYGEGELQRNSARWPAPPDYVAQNLVEAADWILRQPK
jgi:D-glycero-D-manno-heptose 1,7-bisphosphate phosphatase